MNLSHTELVVLAACSTLKGETKGAEGMPSLARSFLDAGAANVVGTLWDIDDSKSAPLFTRLHRRVAAGAAVADALAEAQLDLIHATDRQLRHPSTWAGIEVVGNSLGLAQAPISIPKRR